MTARSASTQAQATDSPKEKSVVASILNDIASLFSRAVKGDSELFYAKDIPHSSGKIEDRMTNNPSRKGDWRDDCWNRNLL